MQCPIVIYNRKIILGTLLFWRVHARTAPHGTWLKRESVGTAETGPKNHAIEETRRKGARHVYIVMDVAVVAGGGVAAVAPPLLPTTVAPTAPIPTGSTGAAPSASCSAHLFR